jgi:hypothetical protein
MSTVALDPLIHDPGRLRVVATLAALPDGDALTATTHGELSQAVRDLPDLTRWKPVTEPHQSLPGWSGLPSW